jgi:hypothetical protein
MFSISSPVPNSVTSFTAFYAHKRAMRSAHAIAASHPTKVVCKACNGTQNIALSVSVYGSYTPPTTSTLKCVSCVDGYTDSVKQVYQSLVMCRCKHGKTSGFIHAQDGQRVFGNTTYLCSACGFVKQFG